MGLKARAAARLDHRYARHRDLAALHRRIDSVESRITDLMSRVNQSSVNGNDLGKIKSDIQSIQEQIRESTVDMGSERPSRGEVDEVARTASEAKRLASESALAIQELLATELRHRQMLDNLRGGVE